MTRWRADNELKNTQFYEIDQLPKIFRFSHERSMLTTGHSARREALSQNPKKKMAAGKGGPWKEKSALTMKL